LNLHGNPQNSFKSFHVGGTNGKGSTVAILDSVLRAAGFKVARFTGPHLLRWNERFHLDGKPIDDETFARYASKIRRLSEEFGAAHPEFGPLTWFEFITALGFFLFKEAAVEVAVLEVGLGGRFDATNVVEEQLLATIITNISLDHTHILGKTEELIAGEKAGIIKPGKLIVTAATGKALDVIAARARTCRAPIVTYANESEIYVILNEANWKVSCSNDSVAGHSHLSKDTGLAEAAEPSSNDSRLTESGLTESASSNKQTESHTTIEAYLRKELAGEVFSKSKNVLPGKYQSQNAALAFLALTMTDLEKLRYTDDISAPKTDPARDSSKTILAGAWSRGLKNVYWPGRMQRVAENLVFDGAHNPAGAKALRDSLDASFPGKRFIFLISCFDNKDGSGILKELATKNDRLFLCEASTRRSTFPKERLLEIAHTLEIATTTFDSISQAYQTAINSISPQEIIVATGSFATIRECMQEIGWQNVEQGRVCGKIDSSENLTLVKNRGFV
jgi:dihydrofolate synthase/folylpolyglutamate synthase